jgi:hypothetical protein
VLTALGVLVAIAVTVITLALTDAERATVPTAVTASQTAAALNRPSGGTMSTAGAGSRLPHYICVADKYCLRCLADNYCVR